MKHLFVYVLLSLSVYQLSAQKTSGNPFIKGWYADPEGRIFNKEYWVYPTYSAPYEQQVFFDAFSSKDLVTWTKHEHILDTQAVKWAHKAMWAPSAIEKDGKYYFFFGANVKYFYLCRPFKKKRSRSSIE